MRVFWLCFGLTCLALGVIGIFLPLLPTTPFLLLSAFAFSRSSERLHNWLLTHPRFGKPIADWQRSGIINRKAKYLALVSIALTFMIGIIVGLSTMMLMIQGAILGLVSLFIITRPEHD